MAKCDIYFVNFWAANNFATQNDFHLLNHRFLEGRTKECFLSIAEVNHTRTEEQEELEFCCTLWFRWVRDRSVMQHVRNCVARQTCQLTLRKSFFYQIRSEIFLAVSFYPSRYNCALSETSSETQKLNRKKIGQKSEVVFVCVDEIEDKYFDLRRHNEELRNRLKKGESSRWC